MTSPRSEQLPEFPPFELQPFADVAAQWQRDRESRGRSSWSRVHYYPEYKVERRLSYIEWAVECPYHSCKAPVGEPCNGTRVMIHQQRLEAYERFRRAALKANGVPDGRMYPKPPWRTRLEIRQEQREVVVQLAATAGNAVHARESLRRSEALAREFGVDEAMIRRAVKAGQSRARREILKSRKRIQENTYLRVQRLARTLRDSLEAHSSERKSA